MKRILVVDDEETNILIIKTVLAVQGYQISSAVNGEEALRLHRDDPFDMIITDWMMPVMNGLILTSTIRLQRIGNPIIILITSLMIEGAKDRAIMCGADIYLPKPLVPDVIRNAVSNGFRRQETGHIKIKIPEISAIRPSVPFSAVGIVASTGGPAVIVEFMKTLTPDSKASYFIVQHGPGWMIETFAKSLSNLTKIDIVIPDDHQPVKPGMIYLASGDYHLTIESNNLVFRLEDSPLVNFVRPSADPLFYSIANTFGIKSIGVVLTGMGCDGAAGAVKIKSVGGQVFVQDPAEAVVPSMPQAALDMGMGIRSYKVGEINEQIRVRLKEISSIAYT
ncbi:chemotaxis response regulator protein-glutamate methylesterase [Ignavibacteriales bacterium]